jgi:hypothetical protein
MSYQSLIGLPEHPGPRREQGEAPLFFAKTFFVEPSDRRSVHHLPAANCCCGKTATLRRSRMCGQHVRGLFRRHCSIWRAQQQSGVELVGRDVPDCRLQSRGHVGEGGPHHPRRRPANATRIAPEAQVHAGLPVVQGDGLHFRRHRGVGRPMHCAGLSGLRRALLVVSRAGARLVSRADQSRARCILESGSNHVQAGHSLVPGLPVAD